MPHSEFVHLHIHTQYSLLDGACRIPQLISLAKKFKMDSLAITDHGNMFGAISFYQEAQKAGIKPIIGSEVYIAPGSRLDKSSKGIEDASYHLVLLARDEQGYKNLMKLVSIGYLEGFYYRPRIDKEVLATYSKGLIGLSACLKGEIPSLLLAKRSNDALKAADDFVQILGKENFYLELQENGIKEQTAVNRGLIKIAKELSIGLAATCDVHYLRQEDALSHDALLCIQTQTMLDDPKRLRFGSSEFYLKSPSQMQELFKEVPEALKNTLEISWRCNLELDFSLTHLPKYHPPGNKNQDVFLEELCKDGVKKRFNNELDGFYKERLKHELKIIKETGFTSYFLIVWDFIHYAKENNIPTGPGRGSAAGSLVSYLLQITDIDPIKYGLLFERFLNPERKELPDIDIDFCYVRRPEVINYVTEKYGQENVAQIITFGTMQARAVIRDVGRVMGISYADVDKLAKMIPPDPNISLKDALETEAELNSLYKNDEQVKRLVETALPLEGLLRHASVHAAGVVIADAPLTDYAPLFRSSDTQITTGFSMDALGKIGLLKVDFLGLRTLTVIQQAVKLIRQRTGKTLDIDEIDLCDEKAFKLLCSAKTMGVFQLESSGMRDLLRKLEPKRFEDLIALLALYRPGPIGSGMLDDFIKRRHGRVAVRYDHKKLEPILKDTYGIIVYQEQVMQIASQLGGFTLTSADRLRRAMSKKIPEVMEEERKNFINGCGKNGISQPTANKIFDLIVYFSGYGFNRSHSTAYAMISYRTAYLKANFPVEFMASLLTSERDNTDKIVEYVNEAAKMGLNILPPDINSSEAEFKVKDDKNISFGLLAIKNVGSGAIESVVEARNKAGAFKDLEDFCSRVDLRLVNRKVIESIIKAGVMDSLGMNRAAMMAGLGNVLNMAYLIHKEKASGQLSFFNYGGKAQNGFRALSAINQIKEWPEPQLLAFEKDMLGFYVSGHPLARFAKHLARFRFCSIEDLKDKAHDQEVKVVGLIAKIKQTTTRAKGEKMAILKLEDLEGIVEVLVFPRTFKLIAKNLLPNSIVMIQGRINLKEDIPKIIANGLLLFDDIYRLITGINIDISGIRESLFESLKERLSQSPGRTPIYLHLDTPSRSRVQLVVGNELFVEPDEKLLDDIELLLGEGRVSLKL
ncbi:MAG: DNA polymerase III subunit alpha [Candidatus Omnitrophota bacterium]